MNGFAYTNATVAANGTTWQIGTIAAATVKSASTNNYNTYIGSFNGSGYSIVNSNAVISTSSTFASGYSYQRCGWSFC